jgi:hypothetical protein
MHGFGYFAHCGSTLTLPTHRYHKNRGVYDVAGLLFAIDCRDFGQVCHICWHHSGDLYVFGHHVRHACNIGWCQSLAPFIDGGPFPHFLHLLTVIMVRWEALWSGWLFGEWWCHEKSCCAAGCSNLQIRSTVMDSLICHSCCRIPHSMISSFVVAPRGWIVFKSVF